MKNKTYLALICLFTLSYKITISQNCELFCVINKDNPNEYSITNANNESVFKLANDTLYNIINSNRYNLNYKKNSKRIHLLGSKVSKLHLIKMLNDTLAIITKNNDIIEMKNETIKCVVTDSGWKYINFRGEVMCEIINSWNNVAHYFKIVGYENFYENEVLSVISLISLRKLSEEFSEQKDDSEVMTNNVWFIMWIVGFVSNK